LNLFDVALVLGADEPGDHPVDHGIDSHHDPFMLPISMALKTRRAATSLCSEFVPLRKSVLGLQQTLMSDSAKTSSGSAEVPSLGGALPAEVFPLFLRIQTQRDSSLHSECRETELFRKLF